MDIDPTDNLASFDRRASFLPMIVGTVTIAADETEVEKVAT